MNQWELEENTPDRRQARENACGLVAIGFGFASDWLSGASFLNESQSKTKAIPHYLLHSIENRSIIALKKYEHLLRNFSGYNTLKC